MPDQQRNVFISHRHEDDSGLKKIKDLVRERGMGIRDFSINAENPNNAKSEQYIKSEILGPRIRQCSILVVYITPDTKQSDWVNWEIEYARKEGLRIVGVWAHGAGQCEKPRALDELGDSVVVGWNAQRVIDAIEGKLDCWDTQDGTPTPIRPIRTVRCQNAR